MNTTKPTPGPWHWDADLYAVVEGVKRWRYRVVAMGRTIMQTYYTEAERGQAEADTRLAASAPELLEALKAAEQCIGELSPTLARAETMQMIQAAIAKATGATP